MIVYTTITGTHESVTIPIPDTMTIAAIENYLRDMRAWLA